MRTNKSRTISKTRVSTFALAAGFAAATASQGAFAMFTADDLERGRADNDAQGAHAVSLGKPGHVILEQEARAEPLGYRTAGDRVGRLPADKRNDRR